jgi:hypothetical protein
MDVNISPVPLEKAYRLINHGPTVLVSSRYRGLSNVMAAAWACVLDYSPPKLTVVLDQAFTTLRAHVSRHTEVEFWHYKSSFHGCAGREVLGHISTKGAARKRRGAILSRPFEFQSDFRSQNFAVRLRNKYRP